MKYQVKSDKLQDVQSNTIRFTAPAQDLSKVTSNAISLSLSDLLDSANIADFKIHFASRVLVAKNLTDSTALTPSISGDSLVLTDVAMAGTDVLDIVIKIK